MNGSEEYCGIIDCGALIMIGLVVGTAIGGLASLLMAGEKKELPPKEPEEPLSAIEKWQPGWRR